MRWVIGSCLVWMVIANTAVLIAGFPNSEDTYSNRFCALVQIVAAATVLLGLISGWGI